MLRSVALLSWLSYRALMVIRSAFEEGSKSMCDSDRIGEN